jgi:hypothetical protein
MSALDRMVSLMATAVLGVPVLLVLALLVALAVLAALLALLPTR